MRFSTTMHQVGRTTGIEVPPEVIAALGGTHVTATGDIGLIKIDGTQVYPTSQAHAEAAPAEDAPASEAANAIDTAADAVSYQSAEPAEREPECAVEEQEPALAASF